MEAALTIDAIRVIDQGLYEMIKKDADVFRSTFRRGQVYNNGTRGIACKAEQPVSWILGESIMKSFKQVSNNASTNFSFLSYPLILKIMIMMMVVHCMFTLVTKKTYHFCRQHKYNLMT